jgi:PRC-barrel domain
VWNRRDAADVCLIGWNVREGFMRKSALLAAAVGCLALSSAAPLAQVRADIASPSTWEAVFSHRDLQAVLGASVHSNSGEDMGHIVQVLVDQTGTARAAVIDFGGFLGVGSRKVVVDWGALHFAPEDQPQQINLDLTREQVKAAPEYRNGKPVVVLGSAVSPTPEF